MIESADLTVSKQPGTHLGYCIYFGKPHILFPQDFSYEGDEKVRDEDFGVAIVVKIGKVILKMKD